MGFVSSSFFLFCFLCLFLGFFLFHFRGFSLRSTFFVRSFVRESNSAHEAKCSKHNDEFFHMMYSLLSKMGPTEKSDQVNNGLDLSIFIPEWEASVSSTLHSRRFAFAQQLSDK